MGVVLLCSCPGRWKVTCGNHVVWSLPGEWVYVCTVKNCFLFCKYNTGPGPLFKTRIFNACFICHRHEDGSVVLWLCYHGETFTDHNVWYYFLHFAESFVPTLTIFTSAYFKPNDTTQSISSSSLSIAWTRVSLQYLSLTCHNTCKAILLICHLYFYHLPLPLVFVSLFSLLLTKLFLTSSISLRRLSSLVTRWDMFCSSNSPKLMGTALSK